MTVVIGPNSNRSGFDGVTQLARQGAAPTATESQSIPLGPCGAAPAFDRMPPPNCTQKHDGRCGCNAP